MLLIVFGGCAESEVPAEDAVEYDGPTISFKDVTREAGLDGFRHVNGASGDKWFPETMGSGAAFIDYNGNGWLDVLVVGGGTWDEEAAPEHEVLWLYRNNGDGTFTLQTEEAGLSGIDAYGFGLVVADYNNDGYQDFYLTTLGQNKLFRNNGGVFEEVTEQAGVGGDPVWSSSAIFFDSNRNGDLDLYVGNYVEWSPETDLFCTLDGDAKAFCTPEEYEGIPGNFYRNNGDGTFSSATVEAGLDESPGKTLGIAELDFNGDGWPDLAVANDTERDLLFENQGDGTFREMGATSGMAYDENGRARAGMGIDVGIVDTTGQETIFIGNFSNEMVGVYRHEQRGIFSDRAAISQIGRPSLLTLTFGLFLFDVNHSGALDLFMANGHVQSEIEEIQEGVGFRQPPQLFLNRRGDGIFTEAPAEGLLASPLVARGAAYGDINNDGKLDILITENNGPAHLWQNETETGRYLRVHLEGVESNRDGLGTRVEVVTNGHVQKRRATTGSSYLSQSEKTLTFGIGEANIVDSLRVFWSSGREDVFTDLAPDQSLHILEGSNSTAVTSLSSN